LHRLPHIISDKRADIETAAKLIALALRHNNLLVEEATAKVPFPS
jgi:hypothetical protein